MDHLIADSGIHFITREIEFNPSEPLLLENGKTLKYSFAETVDFLEGYKIFSMLYYNSEVDKYIPIDELQAAENVVVRRPNGREVLDEAGLITMEPGASTTLFTTYASNDDCVYSINSLHAFRVNDPQDGYSKVPAFELLLDKWLPMPMYRKEVDGVTSNSPLAWCRMKIQHIGEGQKKGSKQYRLVWAFDTQMGEDELSMLRPFVADEDNGACE